MDTAKKEYIQNYGEILLDFVFTLHDKEAFYGINHAEFIFQQIATLINENSFLKEWFLTKVEFTLTNEINIHPTTKRPQLFVSYDLVLYIAHLFKWIEFETLACNYLENKRIEGYNLMNRTLGSSILEAIKKDWEDKDLYKSIM